MKIGYYQKFTQENQQQENIKVNALLKAGISKEYIHVENSLKNKDQRKKCLKMLNKQDTLIIYKLEDFANSLNDLIENINYLKEKNINLIILNGIGRNINSNEEFFNIFDSLNEFMINNKKNHSINNLSSLRARGRKGGRKFQLSKSQVRFAQIVMKNKDSDITELCTELGGISKQTLYRYVSPLGELREYGKKLLNIN
jgi:DNA invertase Pin-like site-specific DNA recombinase